MAVCGRCGVDASVILTRRPPEGGEPVEARAFCTPCWEHHGVGVARLLPPRDWRVEISDPALTGIPRERVEYFLTIERIAPAADLEAIAAGLLQYSREAGRPLPPELQGFTRRHAPPRCIP